MLLVKGSRGTLPDSGADNPSGPSTSRGMAGIKKNDQQEESKKIKVGGGVEGK